MASIGAQLLQMLLRRSREPYGFVARAYCATGYRPRDIAVPECTRTWLSAVLPLHTDTRRVDAITRRRAGAMMRF